MYFYAQCASHNTWLNAKNNNKVNASRRFSSCFNRISHFHKLALTISQSDYKQMNVGSQVYPTANQQTNSPLTISRALLYTILQLKPYCKNSLTSSQGLLDHTIPKGCIPTYWDKYMHSTSLLRPIGFFRVSMWLSFRAKIAASISPRTHKITSYYWLTHKETYGVLGYSCKSQKYNSFTSVLDFFSSAFIYVF